MAVYPVASLDVLRPPMAMMYSVARTRCLNDADDDGDRHDAADQWSRTPADMFDGVTVPVCVRHTVGRPDRTNASNRAADRSVIVAGAIVVLEGWWTPAMVVAMLVDGQ